MILFCKELFNLKALPHHRLYDGINSERETEKKEKEKKKEREYTVLFYLELLG